MLTSIFNVTKYHDLRVRMKLCSWLSLMLSEHCFYFIDHAFDYWFYLASRLWWYQVCSEVAYFQVAPKNDSVRSTKIDTRLVEILLIVTPFVSTKYPLLILSLVHTTKLHYHNLKMSVSTMTTWKLFLFFLFFFFFLGRKSYLSLSTRISCVFSVIAFLNLVFICVLVFAIVSRYHLDLCRNVFGEGVYPDVFMTNLYYGGTGIAGLAFEASEFRPRPWVISFMPFCFPLPWKFELSLPLAEKLKNNEDLSGLIFLVSTTNCYKRVRSVCLGAPDAQSR